MAVLHQLLFALPVPNLNLAHGGENRALGLVRRQGLQSCLGGQLNIDTETVRQKPKLFYQLRRGAGDGLGVDIAVEAAGFPQKPQSADHQFRGVVRTAEHAGGEEQPLNVIPPVEVDG